MSDLSFAQIAPHPALRPYIDFFWLLEPESAPAASSPHLVFPDGGMDIVVNWNASRTSVTPGTPRISGIASHSRMEPLESVAAVVGARFRSGGARALLSISAPDVKDTVAPVEAVTKPHQRGRFESLTETTSPRDCLRRLQQLLMASLSGAASIDSMVLASLQAMEANRGNLRMADLAELGISMRTLRRKFDGFVG